MEEKKSDLTEKLEVILNGTDDFLPHPIFCELVELRHSKDVEKDVEWVETARWVKFEESAYEDGERWSKPHVATISLRAINELRNSLESGTVLFDVDVDDFEGVVETLLKDLILTKNVSIHTAADVKCLLLSKCRHLYEKSKIPHIKSKHDSIKTEATINTKKEEGNSLLSIKLPTNSKHSSTNLKAKGNEHFLKKIPPESEAANILVGMVNFLKEPIQAFIRLKNATQLTGITEVSVPTRFVYILLGPDDRNRCYHEIGRAISTLLSDEIFHEIAYKATVASHISTGIDEFLDNCTVLPPGEWDPNISIKPPKNIPDQTQRKHYVNLNLPSSSDVEMLITPNDSLIRTKRLFGGLIKDIKRKAPFYLSDYKDAISLQTVAAIFFLYFACLTPVITFGGIYQDETKYIGVVECLLGIGFCGVTYHMFAGQPLTIINCTGPMLVFEAIMFKYCEEYGINFLPLRFCVGLWVTVILIIIVAFDLSALVKYITRFTEEIFAMLISVIFCYEAVKKLLHLRHYYPPIEQGAVNCFCFLKNGSCIETSYNHTQLLVAFNSTKISLPSNATGFSLLLSDLNLEKLCQQVNGVLMNEKLQIVNNHADETVFYFSTLLFLGTFVISMYLKRFTGTRFFSHKVRETVSNFGVIIAIIIMVGIDAICKYKTQKLNAPPTVTATGGRSWLINPLDNPVWTIPAAVIPAILASILIFMDQQITCVIINRKENQLKKGAGYHLDLLIIAIQIGLMSVFGFPWFVAATVLSINHVRALNLQSKSAAPGEMPKFLGIREQRVTGICTFLLIGLSVFFQPVLNHIPMAVLYGVFLYMGVSSTFGIQMLQRVFIILMPPKYQPDYMWSRHVPARRIHLFTLIQVVCFVLLWLIKKAPIISIAFPLMIVAICFIRKLMECFFTKKDLSWLDDELPDLHKKKKHDYKKKDSDAATVGTETSDNTQYSSENLKKHQKFDFLRRRHSTGTKVKTHFKIDEFKVVKMTPHMRQMSVMDKQVLQNKYMIG